MSFRGPGHASPNLFIATSAESNLCPIDVPNLARDHMGTPQCPDDVLEGFKEGGLGRCGGCGSLGTEP